MSKACGMYEKAEDFIQMLVGKHKGKRCLGRHRYKWQNKAVMDLKKKYIG
jgi:hypothetical protein